jgi:heat shock protein HslJ
MTGETLPVQPVTGFDESALFVGPTWSATKYYDANIGGLADIAEGSVITLEIEDDGRFDGNAGCNNYFGRLGSSSELQIQQLRSSGNSKSSLMIEDAVGSTMKMCIQEEIMVQEAAYLSNFEGTILFSVLQDGSLLRLNREGGNVIAEYTLFVPRILEHTWIATKYYNAQEDGLTDVILGSNITLKLEVNENLGGSAGCNTYFGAYDDLTVSSFAIAGRVDLTKMYCGQQDALMDQERSYLKTFDGGHMKWRTLDDGSLELRDSDSGAVVALYTTASDKEFDPLLASIDPLSNSGSMAIKTSSAAMLVIAMTLI